MHCAGGGSKGEQKPALGESWRNQPHTRLLLTRDDGQPHRATILSSALKASGDSVQFQLGSGGVLTSAGS